MKRKLILAGGVAMLSSQAFAATAVSSLSNSNQASIAGFNDRVFAWDFTVASSPIMVTSLGYFNPGGAAGGSLPTIAALGIFNAGPTGVNNNGLVASIPAGSLVSFQDGVFSFFDLAAPVMLSSGTVFRMAANTGDLGGANNPVPLGLGAGDPAINLPHTFYNQTAPVGDKGGLTYPAATIVPNGGTHLYLSNFQFQTVPEPGTAMMAALGALALLGCRRR